MNNEKQRMKVEDWRIKIEEQKIWDKKLRMKNK